MKKQLHWLGLAFIVAAVGVVAVDAFSGYTCNSDSTKCGSDGYALWYPSALKTIETKLPFPFAILLSFLGVGIFAFQRLKK